MPIEQFNFEGEQKENEASLFNLEKKIENEQQLAINEVTRLQEVKKSTKTTTIEDSADSLMSSTPTTIEDSADNLMSSTPTTIEDSAIVYTSNQQANKERGSQTFQHIVLKTESDLQKYSTNTYSEKEINEMSYSKLIYTLHLHTSNNDEIRSEGEWQAKYVYVEESSEQQKKLRISLRKALIGYFAELRKDGAKDTTESKAIGKKQGKTKEQLEGEAESMMQIAQKKEITEITSTDGVAYNKAKTPEEKQQIKQSAITEYRRIELEVSGSNSFSDAQVEAIVMRRLEDTEGQKRLDAYTKTFALIQSGKAQEASQILDLIDTEDFDEIQHIFTTVAAQEPHNTLLQGVLQESNAGVYSKEYRRATLTHCTSIQYLSQEGAQIVDQASQNNAQFTLLEQGLANGSTMVETSQGVTMQYDRVTITFTSNGVQIGNTTVPNATAKRIDEAFIKELSSQRQYAEYFQNGVQYRQLVQQTFGLNLEDDATLTPQELERFRLLSNSLGLVGSSNEANNALKQLGIINEQGDFVENNALLVRNIVYRLTRYEPSRLRTLTPDRLQSVVQLAIQQKEFNADDTVLPETQDLQPLESYELSTLSRGEILHLNLQTMLQVASTTEYSSKYPTSLGSSTVDQQEHIKRVLRKDLLQLKRHSEVLHSNVNRVLTINAPSGTNAEQRALEQEQLHTLQSSIVRNYSSLCQLGTQYQHTATLSFASNIRALMMCDQFNEAVQLVEESLPLKQGATPPTNEQIRQVVAIIFMDTTAQAEVWQAAQNKADLDPRYQRAGTNLFATPKPTTVAPSGKKQETLAESIARNLKQSTESATVNASNTVTTLVNKMVTNFSQNSATAVLLQQATNRSSTEQRVQMSYGGIPVDYTETGIIINGRTINSPTASAINGSLYQASTQDIPLFMANQKAGKLLVQTGLNMQLDSRHTFSAKQMEYLQLFEQKLRLKEGYKTLDYVLALEKGAITPKTAKTLQTALRELTQFDPAQLKALSLEDLRERMLQLQ